jgi:hypothetical protein
MNSNYRVNLQFIRELLRKIVKETSRIKKTLLFIIKKKTCPQSVYIAS